MGLLIRKVEALEQKSTKEHKELLNEIQKLKPEYHMDDNTKSEQPIKRRRIEYDDTTLPTFPIQSLEVMDDVIENMEVNEEFKKNLVSRPC